MPRPISPIVEAKAPGSSFPAGTNTAPLVLVVDDNEDNREMYSSYLAFRGCRVATAADGAEALAMAIALRPTIVLLDMGLPGMDGWETTRRIKATPETAALPVIAVTGHVFPAARRRCEEAGVDAFVTKPVTPAHLYDEIARTMERLGLPFC